MRWPAIVKAERAARYSDLFDSGQARPSDCDYCPFCATISIVRHSKPEVLEHLVAAARELVAAAGAVVSDADGFLAALERHHAGDHGRRDDNVTHLDVG